jgi:hypothetical protein
MKRLIIFFIVVLSVWSCEKDPPEKYEDLYISVYESEPTNPISGTILTLIRLAEREKFSGATNKEGKYCFSDLKSGEYSITLEKENYETKTDTISVIINKKNSYEYFLKGIPASLNLEPTLETETLDFGENSNTEPFSFRNDHDVEILWRIFHSCSWIKSVSSHSNKQDSGTLAPHATETVAVIIDRTKLPKAGSNVDNISVGTSEHGGAKVTIIAFNKNEKPIVVTDNVTSITATNATLRGTITYEGKPPYTERGFVYSKSSNPTIDNRLGQQTVPKTSEPTFSAVIPITANETYYVRAYAINSNNSTAYGNEINFTGGIELASLSTNAATNITTTSAVLGGKIITVGAPTYTEKGVCYSTSSFPTVESGNLIIIPGNGNSIGDFSQNVTGLISGKKYYVRAYAKTGNSGVAYGNELSFTTLAPVVVSTQSVSNSNVTTSTATVYGSIFNAGIPAYSEKGICYGFSNNPKIETDFSIPVSGTGVGAYSATLSGLDAFTTYHACAYAKNDLGYVYGNTVNFTTKIEKANVSTQAPTQLSGSSVRLNGTILNIGNPNYTEKGFVCSMSSAPTITDTKIIVPGQGTGTFTATFNYGNNYIYSYHVRAYVINADGSANYGTDHLFFFEVEF